MALQHSTTLREKAVVEGPAVAFSHLTPGHNHVLLAD